MKLRDGTTEDNIPTTVFECGYCRQEFSICPAVGDDRLDLFEGCTAPGCESYDPARDIDIVFMNDKALADHADQVGVVDFNMLTKRRKFQSGEVDFADLNKGE